MKQIDSYIIISLQFQQWVIHMAEQDQAGNRNLQFPCKESPLWFLKVKRLLETDSSI